MTGQGAFVEIFGDITVATIISWVMAAIFMISIGKRVKEYFERRIKADQEKNAQLVEVFDAVKKVSLIEANIKELRDGQDRQEQRLRNMEERTDRRERSKMRDRLLQNYRYYTSKDRNPRLSWTRMESDSFWDLFKDYEEAGGDGYIHSVVQPAMNSLFIVEMTDTESIADLMHSRN